MTTGIGFSLKVRIEVGVGKLRRHCEERSDEAIQLLAVAKLDCFAALAMTKRVISFSPGSRRDPAAWAFRTTRSVPANSAGPDAGQPANPLAGSANRRAPP